MSTTDPTTGSATDLAARYGTAARSRRRRAVAGASAVVVVAFGGWLAWATLVQADPSVASGNLTWDDDDTSTNQVTGRFDVDMKDGVDEARCTLKAYALDHSLVGSITFAVPAGTSRVEQAVATERRAVNLELVGCTTDGQKRPR